MNVLTPALSAQYQVEAGWQFGLTFRTRWSDQDAFAHVNHRTHFIWCEEVRNAYLADAGFPIQDAGVPGPVLRDVGCRYERPLSLGQIVLVTGRTAWLGNTSFGMEYAVWYEGLVARGHATCVWYRNSTGQSVPVPQALRDYMVRDGALPRAGSAPR